MPSVFQPVSKDLWGPEVYPLLVWWDSHVPVWLVWQQRWETVVHVWFPALFCGLYCYLGRADCQSREQGRRGIWHQDSLPNFKPKKEEGINVEILWLTKTKYIWCFIKVKFVISCLGVVLKNSFDSNIHSLLLYLPKKLQIALYHIGIYISLTTSCLVKRDNINVSLRSLLV